MHGDKKPLPFLKLRTLLVLRWREFEAYSADLKGSKASEEKKNILIFGQGRSGTTLFEHLMCSTGHFVGYHEVLNTVTREVLFPARYVRGLGRKTAGENVILHVKPDHLTFDRKSPVDSRRFLEFVVEDGWHIVHVQRTNVFMRIVSNYLALARGGYHKTDVGEEVQKPLHIPPDEFFMRYEKSWNLLNEEKRILGGLPHTKVNYENDLEKPWNHQCVVDNFLNELNLESKPVSTKLRKINKFPPHELISNLDELQEGFLARGWEWPL